MLIVGRDIEAALANKLDMKNAMELHIMDSSADSKVAVNDGGEVCFLGTLKEDNIQWVNLRDKSNAGHELYADSKVTDATSEEFRGNFVANQKLGSGEAVWVDMEKMKYANDKAPAMILIITQQDEIVSTMLNYTDDGQYCVNKENYTPVDRILADDRRLMEQQLENKLVVKSQYIKLLEKEQYFEFAYCPEASCILYKGAAVGMPVNGAERNYIMAVYRSKESMKERFDISDCVKLLNSSGYLYIEPFKPTEPDREYKLTIVANRSIGVEIYSSQTEEWKSISTTDAIGASGDEDVRLRLCVEFGDRIRKVLLS